MNPDKNLKNFPNRDGKKSLKNVGTFFHHKKKPGNKNGIIEKKSSPIDYSYTFYLIEISKNLENTEISKIEFFPPSHMIVTKNKLSSESLVCWR